jgi:hypothetical protein
LVSFNDYPLGDIEGAGSPTSGGKSASGGIATGDGGDAEGPASSGGSMTWSSDNVIDDFEDGNQALPELAGRSGAWYVANDGRGMQTPPMSQPLMPSPLMPMRAESEHGARTFGGPFQTWGALIGTSLATEAGKRVAYDLSAYEGIRLWVRSGSMAPSAAKTVRLNILTPATLPGGGCFECNDHFGAVIPLTPQWQQVDVNLGSLAQSGFGTPKLASPDLEQALALELLVARGVTFDLWVDDIELY